MSTGLYWEPVVDKRKRVRTDDEISLRRALREAFGAEPYRGDKLELGRESIAVLKGIAAGGTKGAHELIALIEKYDIIAVWEES